MMMIGSHFLSSRKLKLKRLHLQRNKNRNHRKQERISMLQHSVGVKTETYLQSDMANETMFHGVTTTLLFLFGVSFDEILTKRNQTSILMLQHA